MGETTKAQQEQCTHSCRVSAVGRVEGRRRAEGRGRWIQPSARLSSVCRVRAPQAQWLAAALLALATLRRASEPRGWKARNDSMPTGLVRKVEVVVHFNILN